MTSESVMLGSPARVRRSISSRPANVDGAAQVRATAFGRTMHDMTRVLCAIDQGDSHAAEQLLPLVYDALRELAAAKLAQEKPGQTLQATALVHEAYLRLVEGDKAAHWNSRAHFFGAAAEAMRRILVDQARRKQADKRGGQGRRVPLDAADVGFTSPADGLLDIDEALTHLAAEDPQAARLIQLRYFAGLSIADAAEVVGISRSAA
jgi:RNA polymerase sigma factor (TIGR02999 family)